MMDLDCITCHGGITYASDFEPFQFSYRDGWWIGWDYSHSGDFRADYPELYNREKYTTADVIHECIHVINQVVG